MRNNPLNTSHVLDQYVRRNFEDISCSAVIISQLQRSGGSLMSQLFDGHQELYVHPSELHIGRPNKYYWPNIDLRVSEEKLFDALWEHTTFNHSLHGYKKSQKSKELYRFIFFPELQKKIFCESVRKARDSNNKIDQRKILDAYITSYFNSWLDYERSKDRPKFWVSFVARTLTYKQNVEAFLRDYPDGKIIQIIREPKSWYASAKHYLPEIYQNLDQSLSLWVNSTKRVINNSKKYNRNVKIVLFRDLIINTEETMQDLCKFLNIEFSSQLLVPTFNGGQILSNSSFKDTKGVINQSAVVRRPYLSTIQTNYIDKHAGPLYAKITEAYSIAGK